MKFKVGDWVESSLAGMGGRGEIVSIRERPIPQYLIRYEGRTDLHSGNGVGDFVSSANDCWWIHESELRLCESANVKHILAKYEV